MDVASTPRPAQGDPPNLRGVQLVSVLTGILLPPLALNMVEGFAISVLPRAIAGVNGFDRYSWPSTMFLLTSTIAMPIIAKLSDLHGRKRFYLCGAALSCAYAILTN